MGRSGIVRRSSLTLRAIASQDFASRMILPRSRACIALTRERGQKKPSGPSLELLALVKAKGLDAIA